MLRCPILRSPRIAQMFLVLCVSISALALLPAQQNEIERLDIAIQENPQAPYAYQQRGIAHFMNGSFRKAIADFDRVIELIPEQEARHWQRGIAYYYSGEYEKGVAQFELHQSVNSQDVENAVWHFICKAKVDGLEAARKTLIPIKHDSRPPMMEIWKLFAGAETPEGVLKAARQPGPSGRASRQSMCYAHLYLGLYYEVAEQPSLAKRHIDLAANEYSMDNYMGRVAKLHYSLLENRSIQ